MFCAIGRRSEDRFDCPGRCRRRFARAGVAHRRRGLRAARRRPGCRTPRARRRRATGSPGGAGKAEARMDDVAAGRQRESRRRGAIFLDEAEYAGGIGFRRIDPPDDPGRDRRRVPPVARRDRQRDAASGTIGAVCATAGAAGAGATGVTGANGAGLIKVAPGEPVPGVNGTGAVACGASRPRPVRWPGLAPDTAPPPPASRSAEIWPSPTPHAVLWVAITAI